MKGPKVVVDSDYVLASPITRRETVAHVFTIRELD